MPKTTVTVKEGWRTRGENFPNNFDLFRPGPPVSEIITFSTGKSDESVEEMATRFRTAKGMVAEAPAATTVGGVPAIRFDTVVKDAPPSPPGAPPGFPPKAVLLFFDKTKTQPSGPDDVFDVLEEDTRARLFLLDVSGTRMLIYYETKPDRFADFQKHAEEVLATVKFG